MVLALARSRIYSAHEIGENVVTSTIDVNDVAMKTQDVADFLGMHRRTIQRLCQEGKIPASKVGRDWYILRSDLIGLIHHAG